MTPSLKIDCLIEPEWIAPVEPAMTVLHNHTIAIDQGIIKAIIPTDQANSQFDPSEHITLKQHLLTPGLINLHTHAAMTLMRGLADDITLLEWLNQHIWPAESRHADYTFVFDGTRLACAEMLLGGTTCFNDMYFFPEAAAEAAQESGIRAVIGMIAIDFPSIYASDADDYLAKGLATRDRFNQHSNISFSFAPHAPYTVNNETFVKILTFAEQLDCPIHLHLHETQEEIRIEQESSGLRPITRLQKLGLVSPNLIGVHMVHLTDNEIRLFNQQNGSIAHCPSSNLKLASGIAPVNKLLNQGINVGLGTDSAASNNRLDMFAEMRLAALLAKAESGQASTLSANQALHMATLAGARALGLEHITGSLVAGKAADIVAIDFSSINLAPCYDPVSHLVYAAGREHVSHVWVNGKMVLKDKQLTNMDTSELLHRAALWQQRIRKTDDQR